VILNPVKMKIPISKNYITKHAIELCDLLLQRVKSVVLQIFIVSISMKFKISTEKANLM